MKHLLALLLLAAPAAAQIVVGSASFSVGDEIVYTGGAGQGPQTRQTGLTIELNAAVARFAPDTCFGTQARLERALVDATRDGKLAPAAPVDDATLAALTQGRYLKTKPADPEVTHGYSWWNYRRSYDGKIACRTHGDFRRAPPPPDLEAEAEAP